MTFRKVGFVIDVENQPIHLVFGFVTFIEYPENFMYKINEQYPGLIRAFVHTNPVGNIELSKEDKDVLRNWTIAFKPHPICMAILCKYKDDLYCYRVFKYESGVEDEPRCMADVVSGRLDPWQERLIRFSYV